MHEETVTFLYIKNKKRVDNKSYWEGDYIRNHQQEENNMSKGIQARSNRPVLLPCRNQNEIENIVENYMIQPTFTGEEPKEVDFFIHLSWKYVTIKSIFIMKIKFKIFLKKFKLNCILIISIPQFSLVIFLEEFYLVINLIIFSSN